MAIFQRMMRSLFLILIIQRTKIFQKGSYVKRPHLENIKRGITLVEQPDDCMPLKTKSNERLEFLGDGVLELITKYRKKDRSG